MVHMLLIHVYIWDNYVRIHMQYELNAINNITAGTGIHTFDIIDICPSATMLASSHMYLPLHYYCGSCIAPKWGHIQEKQVESRLWAQQ